MPSEYDGLGKQLKSDDIFIGREEELALFKKILNPKSDIHILNIYSTGPDGIGVGGIGKTQLLLHMQNICRNLPHVTYSRHIIDFYDTESRTKTGVLRQIVENLNPKRFPRFVELCSVYEQAKTGEERKALSPQVEETFRKEYAEFSKINNIVVLFFDTYESIRGTDATEHSKWLEKSLFPYLNDNTRLVVAGRHLLRETDDQKIQEINLSKFTFDDTVDFWKRCFDVKTNDELKDFLNLDDHEIKKFHRLAGGKPILLALFADWINDDQERKDKHIFDPEELLEEIEKQAGKIGASVSQEQLRIFEEALVERFWHLGSPRNYTVACMAFAHRRMTPDMLDYLIKEVPIKDTEISLPAPQNFLEKLGSLSFVKPKQNNVFLLHDEMQRLITQYWWNEQDIDRTIRKKTATRLVEYYNALIEKEDTSIFHAERHYYLLYADLDTGFKEFVSQFDENLKKYRINHCQLLFQEISRGEFYNELSPLLQAEIDLRSARWYNEQYRCEETLSLLKDIKQDEKKKKIIAKTDDGTYDETFDWQMSANFEHEYGVAYLWLNRFKEATLCFAEAEKAFRKLGDRSKLAWELNWLGYAHYRDGDLKNSQKVIERSIKEFLKIQESPEDAYIGISNAYSNLNPVLRRQGRFYEASNNGEIAVAIAEEKQNDRELMRFLHALAETYKFANKSFEASQICERAFAILESAPDPLLKARLLISKALLSYIHSDYIYIMEYYRRGEERGQALSRFHEVYMSAKKQLEEAEQIFEEARIILEKDIKTPTAELADLYFYMGEYYTITDNWQKSLELFRQAEDTAKTVRNEYREVDAVVGQIMVYYFEGSETENEQEIQSCKERISKSKYRYPNLLGKMEIMLGNLSYERYLENKNENDLRECVTKYVAACDYMLAFTRLIPPDRFYATLRILAKRLGDLPPDFLPDRETAESFRDIWDYDLKEKLVCQKYGDIFDAIVDFTLKRTETLGNSEKWKDYAETCRERHEKCISDGKEKLRFVPVYDEMWLRSQIYSGSDTGMAEAHFYLAEAYNVNDNLFEAHKNIVLALQCAEKADDALLKARILVRLGQLLYRRGEYVKTIEYYRKSDIRENVQNFMRKSETYISKCTEYFKEAEDILNGPADDEKRADYVRGHLYFRWAELMVVLGDRHPEEIEKLFSKSAEAAERGGNLWRQINATQSLIAHYYFSDQWEAKQDAVSELRTKFEELNEKKLYCPVLIARHLIIEGNVKYDQIFSKPDDEELIEGAFNNYILATRNKAEYSEKHFYEAVGMLIDRIAKLPKDAVKILYKDVYPKLQKKRPTGVIADDAYKLIEQFLQIRSEVL